MPMAFRNAGLLFGGLGTIIIGILCTHCVHIFVSDSEKYQQNENLLEEWRN